MGKWKKGPFDVPGITAASASNSQEIDVYVALEEGVYRDEPSADRLTPIAAGDLRAFAIGQGQTSLGADAPVRLIYVVDIGKFAKAGYQEPGLNDSETQKAYYYVDTGLWPGTYTCSRPRRAWRPGSTTATRLSSPRGWDCDQTS